MIDRYYRHVPSRQVYLDQAIHELVGPSVVLLDAGCGSEGPLLARYGPKVSLAVGVDLCTPTVAAPPRSAMMVANLEGIPLRSASVDVLISRSVLEHIENPVAVFREFSRVLRPGGTLVFTTPNKYYYSCVISRLLPEGIKDRYFQTVFGEEAYDHFPVYYRANTVGAFRKLAAAARFRVKRVEAIRHYPYYLMFSSALFRLGMLYDWVVTALKLDSLQSNWLVVMERE